MNPRFFIERPVFASVLSILIVIAGLVSLQKLPVAQFPQIAPPMIQIEADYPGASAEVVAESVARPIEIQLPGIDNLLYYDSTSTNDGHMVMRLTFEIGTDVDIAQVQTQNRQKLAEPQLPDEVIRQGITVKKMSPNLLAVVALNSTDPKHDPVFISNYALIQVLDNIKRIPGVGDAVVYGAQNYAMRLILDPVRMAQLNITPTEIANVVREQNRDFPAGRIGREPTAKRTELTIPVITRGRMSEVGEFEDMIIRAYPDGSMVRMRDVARVELGAQSYDLEGRWNGITNTFLLTFLAPGANALETVKHVREEMARLASGFPTGMSYDVPYDTTQFIEVSINEVFKTLIEASILVILVVFLFLQSWRATLIPAVAVPISLIGALAGMHALGFSINTLTLFGMVLAIGIVVDDAIIVVENVERNITKGGLSPKDAAIKAMNEVTGAIIASVLVLAAVFVPVTFLEGITGQLYQQFAATIAISVAISGFVALTLSLYLGSPLQNFPFPRRKKILSLHLPQGAPTSPALANLCAFRLDVRLKALAQSMGLTYSRYADDLTFSGGKDLKKQFSYLRGTLSEIAAQEGFKLNPEKTRLMTQAQRQVVTGVVVNKRPNISRAEYDRLKAVLHQCAQGEEVDALFKQSLRGKVEFIRALNPKRGEKLLRLLQKL